MTKRFCLCLSVLILCAGYLQAAQEQAAPPKDYVGRWSGAWDGAGSGGFELVLEKGKDGTLGGNVSVTGEPTYKATLKTLKIEDGKLTATYDFPPEDSLEIQLIATFSGESVSGTWTARAKSGGDELMTGGWNATRK